MLTKQCMLTCFWTARLNFDLSNSQYVEIICQIFGTPPTILIDRSYVAIFCLNLIIIQNINQKSESEIYFNLMDIFWFTLSPRQSMKR